MRLMKDRKGIEPLIASVLLIVVVVGIGAVVTGIVRNYVSENKQTITEKASEMKCGTELQMEVPTVAGQYKICKNSTGLIRFMLQNTGSITIDELQIKVFGASGFVSNDTVLTGLGMTSGITVGTTVANINWTYNTASVGTLQEIKIIPRISVAGRTEKAFCVDSGLSYSDLPTCT